MEERYIQMMDAVYQFVMYSMDEYNAPTDYGTGKILNMVQMHTLSIIAENPGIRVSDVAAMWNRTLGAASKNVRKLCEKGYVEKRKQAGDGKTVHLYATQSGTQLHHLHRAFDRRQVMATAEHLLRHHTEQDLVTFHQVLQTCIRLYEERRTEHDLKEVSHEV